MVERMSEGRTEKITRLPKLWKHVKNVDIYVYTITYSSVVKFTLWLSFVLNRVIIPYCLNVGLWDNWKYLLAFNFHRFRTSLPVIIPDLSQSVFMCKEIPSGKYISSLHTVETSLNFPSPLKKEGGSVFRVHRFEMEISLKEISQRKTTRVNFMFRVSFCNSYTRDHDLGVRSKTKLQYIRRTGTRWLTYRDTQSNS